MVEVVGCELKYFSRTGVIVVAALPLLLPDENLSLWNTLFRVIFIILLPIVPVVLGAATVVPVDAFATEDVFLSDVAVIPVDKTDARRFISLEDICILYSFLPSTRWLFSSHYFDRCCVCVPVLRRTGNRYVLAVFNFDAPRGGIYEVP